MIWAANVETRIARTFTFPGYPRSSPVVRPSPPGLMSLTSSYCLSTSSHPLSLTSLLQSPIYAPTALDEDTAQFLCSSIPAAQRFGPEVFMKALDVARLANPTMAFEARVQEALSRLGLR